jgi:hypothetical protein
MEDKEAVSSTDYATSAQESNLPYFPVSLAKFAIMVACTFGLYSLYWQFCHWLYVRDNQNVRLSPGWRALFSIIFCYPLFRRIQRSAIVAGVRPGPPAGLLAIGWVFFALCGSLPPPFFLVYFVSIAFLIPVQRVANKINKLANPGHDPNGAFSVLNKVTVVVGGLLLIFTAIGAFLSPR